MSDLDFWKFGVDTRKPIERSLNVVKTVPIVFVHHRAAQHDSYRRPMKDSVVDAGGQYRSHFFIACARRAFGMHAGTHLERAAGNKRFKGSARPSVHDLMSGFKVVCATVDVAIHNACGADARTDAEIRNDTRVSARAVHCLTEAREVGIITDFHRSTEGGSELLLKSKVCPVR